MRHHVADRNFFVADLVNRTVLDLFEDLAERFHQIEKADRQTGIVILRNKLLHLRIRPDVLLDHPLLLQHLGGVFEALMLQQPLDQFFARIFFLLAGLLERGIGRQQHPRLDVDQRRRHEDELGADIEILLARLIQIRQILRGDGRDRNIPDIDLLPPDQIEQQVERPVVRSRWTFSGDCGTVDNSFIIACPPALLPRAPPLRSPAGPSSGGSARNPR